MRTNQKQSVSGISHGLDTHAGAGPIAQVDRRSRSFPGMELALALALFASPALTGASRAQEQTAPPTQVTTDFQAADPTVQTNDTETPTTETPVAESETAIDDSNVGDEVPVDDSGYAADQPVDDGSASQSADPGSGGGQGSGSGSGQGSGRSLRQPNRRAGVAKNTAPKTWEVQLHDGRKFLFDKQERAAEYAREINAKPQWKATIAEKTGYPVTLHSGETHFLPTAERAREYAAQINANSKWRAEIGTKVPKLAVQAPALAATPASPSVHAVRPSVESRIESPTVHSSMPQFRPSAAAARMPALRSAPIHSMPMRSFGGMRGMGFH